MYSSVQCVVLSYVRFSTVVYIKHHHPELSLDSFALLCRVSLLLTYYLLVPHAVGALLFLVIFCALHYY
jgi:hypothetical protein